MHRLPKVSVLSTGNEVIEPGIELRPGAIRDSNRITLLSLLRHHHFPTYDLGIAKDEQVVYFILFFIFILFFFNLTIILTTTNIFYNQLICQILLSMTMVLHYHFTWKTAPCGTILLALIKFYCQKQRSYIQISFRLLCYRGIGNQSVFCTNLWVYLSNCPENSL